MSAKAYDINGWFEIKDNPISREGIFQYSGAQIGAPAHQSGQIFRVLRPAEELQRPEAMESFRLVPIIDDHTMLGGANTPAEEKGVAGVIGENLNFKDGVLYANLKIFSNDLAQKIKNGKTELSCGYRCVYEFTSGTWNGQNYDAIQRHIRGNHVALVDEGRMGPEVSILDQKMVFTVDAKETSPVDEELKAMLAAIVARLEKLEAAKPADPPATDEDDETPPPAGDEDDETPPPAGDEDGETPPPASDEEADKPATMDAALKEIRKLQASVAKLSSRPAMDEKSFVEISAKKTALVQQMTPLIGVFDAASMTYEGVVAYGVEKLGLKPAKGEEGATLAGYLAAAKAPTPYSTAMDAKAKSSLAGSIAKFAEGA